jgi:3-hydroxyacyl-CoA dehydrogenase
MSELVSYTKLGNVAVLTVNNPPVNALSPGVPEGIAAGIEAARKDAAVAAVVLIGGGRTFIAGADINEFGKLTSGEKSREEGGLHTLLQLLEDTPKPIVCAIHGTALGGGLEVAMACHYRVAAPTASVGQPEVKLGIIPGAAGTQRLPRLCGIAKAAEMCALGNPVLASEAGYLGIVDRLVEGDLLEGACSFARERIESGESPRRTREIQDRFGDPEKNAEALARLRELVAAKARGQIAGQRAIDAVELAATVSFEKGCEREAELFDECLYSPQSKGLIHVFFSERAVAKIPDVPKDTPRLSIESAAVIGAGTMGAGIAMAYVNAGIPVVLKEVDQERLDRGLGVIRGQYESAVSKRRMTPEQFEKRMELIQPTLAYTDIGAADIVVEAVFEDMSLKKKVFAEMDGAAREGAILASNTSTLDIDAIASVTRRPESVIGHHFFSPAHLMRLLEIVRGQATSLDVIATSMALSKRLRKIGVLVGNGWGFVGNRMFGPFMREAQVLVEEGAAIEEVDAAMTEFGMAMGPLTVADLAGIDVGWRVREESADRVPPGLREPIVPDRLYHLGRYGQKTGAGWYRYEKGVRRPVLDPEVVSLVADVVREQGIEQRKIGREEIVERIVYGLINEGAHVLGEGLALRSSDIDIVYINGYGFPAYRGGPMFYADTVGLKNVHARLCEFEERLGFWWKPAPLLEELATQGKSFADYPLT